MASASRESSSNRTRLIKANIFPTVHCPFEETVLPVGAEARDVCHRLLSIYCDDRAGLDDVVRAQPKSLASGREAELGQSSAMTGRGPLR